MRRLFAHSLLPLALFSLSLLHITQASYAFFPFFSCTPSGLEPPTFCLALAYQSLFYTTRFSWEFPPKSNFYFTWLVRIPKNLHYNLPIHVFNACCTLHKNMHCICGSLVNKRWRGWFIYFSQSLRELSRSYTVINRYPNTSMSSLNGFKLCKILTDHVQCAYSGARNTSCPRCQ